MHNVKSFQQNRQVRVLFGSMIHKIHQFSFHKVEMVQLEYTRSLKNKNLDNFSQSPKLLVVLITINQLEKHLSKKKTVLVGLSLSDENTLIPKTSL